VLVIGGGGALGSSVLEQLLAQHGFGHVRVLATPRFRVGMQGLEPLVVESFDDVAPVAAATGSHTEPVDAVSVADIAVVVFDRERHANGRDEAFMRLAPEALPDAARWLHGHGVRHLVVVMPHQTAGMPQTLTAGLANLDEQAVASVGFSHVVFVRSAQSSQKQRGGPLLARIAHSLLAQLMFMVPQAEQPVRARKVAQFVAELAARLPQADAGTRVAAPALVWQASQMAHSGALVSAWLAGLPLPPVSVPRRRM
jgi:nucleoside-diphosphate-sugar epimerase